MKPHTAHLYRCPECGGALDLHDAVENRGEVESGRLVCASHHGPFPIVGFVPRFVPASNYASSFGFQWNRFSRTQLDSHSGLQVSRDRFFQQSRWSPES